MGGKRPTDEGLLRRMTALLSHRGPDGEGFHVEPGVGFGHRRLSIIDLDGGKQPLYNEDLTVVVTYNGEIYNFKELEQELLKLGHKFRTRCDTEVIVHAWEAWGPACVERFNGMFAFAIWDRKRQELFLARDRLGVKPLYYAALNDGRILFASELKAILACPAVDRRVDPRAVEEYFAFGYVPDPRTIYVGAAKLEPGCVLHVKHGQSTLAQRRYWDVPLDQPAKGNADDLIVQLKACVAKRLVAEVPLGAFLSGGIDSSAIVAMMREIGVEHLLTCSIGFRESLYDESRYASLVARAKSTDHRMEIVAASDFGLLDRLVSLYDEPFADSSAIPTYRVCQLARRHVTVALSGDGGDENFIGYRRYRLFGMEERVRGRLPLRLRQAVFGPLGRVYPKLDWAPRVLRGKTTFQSLARCSADAYHHTISICSDEMRASLFSNRLKADLQDYRAKDVFRRYLANKEFSDPLRMVQYLDFKTYLPGDILTKVDRASMAHSLEVRVPFLDYQFVEWTARLPTEEKLKGQEGKRILKKALEPYLPKEVLYRKKMGFAVPLDGWFRDSLKERIEAAISGDRLRDCGLFDPAYLKKLLEEHRSGRRNHSAPLWSLLMFDGFLRQSD